MGNHEHPSRSSPDREHGHRTSAEQQRRVQQELQSRSALHPGAHEVLGEDVNERHVHQDPRRRGLEEPLRHQRRGACLVVRR
jgi:hypothetical protein